MSENIEYKYVNSFGTEVVVKINVDENGEYSMAEVLVDGDAVVDLTDSSLLVGDLVREIIELKGNTVKD